MADKEPELKENDFIHEGIKDDPYPLFYWFVVLLCVGIVSWGISTWVDRVTKSEIASTPFLQVSNRQFSLFLWQNPEFMRIHLSDKAAYLPAFNYIETLSMKPEMAEDYVAAPPDILFKTRHSKYGQTISAGEEGGVGDDDESLAVKFNHRLRLAIIKLHLYPAFGAAILTS